MKFVFREADGTHYAGAPQTEKVREQRFLRFVHSGCTSYLLLCAPLDKQIDLHSEKVQKAIAELPKDLTEDRAVSLPGMNHISIRWIKNDTLFCNNDHIEIRDEAANYAICGVLERDGEFQILIPLQGMTYTTAVAVELRYSAEPYFVEVKKGFFRKELEQTDFCIVNFDHKPCYTNGMVYYTVGKSPCRYPVTERMMGATVLIKTKKQPLEFHSATPGVLLKKK